MICVRVLVAIESTTTAASRERVLTHFSGAALYNPHVPRSQPDEAPLLHLRIYCTFSHTPATSSIEFGHGYCICPLANFSLCASVTARCEEEVPLSEWNQ